MAGRVPQDLDQLIALIRRSFGGVVVGGDVSSAIATHANDEDAHHNWPLLESDIPGTIARDTEVTTAIATHTSNPAAHHNWPLLDGDIPATIARDTEVSSAIATHTSNPNAHHNQQHNLIGSDHTIAGAQWQVLGLTATNTLGLLTPSYQPSGESLLKTDSTGYLHLPRFQAGVVTGNWVPEFPDTSDLGTFTKRWRKGWLSELESVLFVENSVSAIGGLFIVPHGQGTLPADIGAGDTTIDFGQAMAVNDFIILSGNLMLEYLQIGTLVSGTTYNVTRNVDGTGANDWPQGHVFVVYGYSGDGRIEFDAQTGGPQIRILKQGATYNAQTETVRIGDLSGWGGHSGHGFGMGNPSGNRIVYDGTSLLIIGDGGDITNIDGGNILADSITATQLAADSVTATQINVSTLSAISANMGTITAGTITGATFIAGGGSVTIDANGISIDDASTSSEALAFRKGTTVIGKLTGTYDGAYTNTMRILMSPAAGYGNKTKVELLSEGDLPGNRVGLHLQGTSGSQFAGDRAWLDIGSSLWRFGIDSVGTYQKYFTAPSNARIDIQDVKATNLFGATGAITGLVVGQESNIYAVDEQIRLYRGSTLMGQISTSDTTWTRWNQDVAKNIYTPRAMAIGTSLIVGTSTIQPAGVIAATSDGRFGGGISAGSYTSDPGTGNLLYTGAIRKVYSGTAYTCASPPVLLAYNSWQNIINNATRTSANNGLVTLTNIPAGVKYVYIRFDANPSALGHWAGAGPASGFAEHMIQYIGGSNHAAGLVRTNGTNQLYMQFNGTIYNVNLWVTGYGF